VHTFERARLRWDDLHEDEHQRWLALHRTLLRLRREHIVPLLAQGMTARSDYRLLGDRALLVNWYLTDQSHLTLLSNLNDRGITLPASLQRDPVLFATPQIATETINNGKLPPWSVCWMLARQDG
jgi:1,4-alpha-glucan branching enzyme